MILYNSKFNKTIWNSQIDIEIDNLTKLGQQNNIDVSNCTKIGHVAQKKAVTIVDKASTCIMDKVTNVTHDFIPVNNKFNKAMVVLSNFTTAIAFCVSNPNHTVVDNVPCLLNVSLLVCL